MIHYYYSWKDETIEEECAVTHTVVIQGSGANDSTSQNILTVQVSECNIINFHDVQIFKLCSFKKLYF